MTPKPPLPLEGEGVGGWGVGAPPTNLNAEDSVQADFISTSKIKAGGIARARRLLSDQTLAERRLWERLRLLPIRFRRQVPIGPYVVDFACHASRLVIEVDGGVHDRTDVAVRDLKRDDWFSAQGYSVLRISNRRVIEDIDAAVAQVTKAAGVSLPTGDQPAHTPSQPFPLEGKGFSEV